MKIRFCFLIILLVLFSCRNTTDNDGFIIKGQMSGDYKGKAQKPTGVTISGEGIGVSNRNFFIENKEISAEISSEIKEMDEFSVNWFYVDSVWGTTTAKVESEIFHALENDNIRFKRAEEILEKYKEHPVSGNLLSELANREVFSKDSILKLLSRADRKVISAHDLTRIFLYTNPRIQKGDTFEDFSLPDMEDKMLNTKEFRKDNYLFIDFWASWCAPCREAFPELLVIKERYEEKQIRFLGVSLDKNKESWEKAIQKDNLNWTNLIDTLAHDGAVARNYHITAIPYNLLVDSDGIILEMNLSSEELEQKLEAIFNSGG